MLTDGDYTYSRDLAMYITVKSLCCTSEINVVLYINYISIKKTD